MIVRVLSRLVLIVLYFVVVTPAAMVRRLMGNPLHHNPGDMGYWARRQAASNDAAAMQRLS